MQNVYSNELKIENKTQNIYIIATNSPAFGLNKNWVRDGVIWFPPSDS